MNDDFNDFNNFNNPNGINNPNGFHRRSRRVTYRPSKASGAISTVAGAVMCLIGIIIIIPSFGLFGIFWTALAIAITVFNAYRAFGKKNIGPEIYIEDDSAQPQQPAGSGTDDIEQRLEKLSELHDKGLVTDAEYEDKRQEILDEL